MKTTINQGELGKLCADAIAELISACAKHPEWPSDLTDNLDLDDVQYVVKACRETNDKTGYLSAQSIFDEELFEFFEQVMLGNAEAARAELVQAMAMLLRMYCHLPNYIAQAKSTSN